MVLLVKSKEHPSLGGKKDAEEPLPRQELPLAALSER